MGSFAGLLAGYGEAQHQKHVEDMNNVLGQRKSILDLYGNLLQNPQYSEAHPDIANEMVRLSSIDPAKLPKALKDYSIAPILEPSIRAAHNRPQPQQVNPNSVQAPPPPVIQP